MIKDNINLIDGDYENVVRDSRVSSTQIKTRQSSFHAISNFWRKFRISSLNKKLERMKDNLMDEKFTADSSNRISKRSENRMLSRTAAIARVEEKIKILSREEVPSNYVANRAIKLKDKMMKNLRYNSGNAYSIGVDVEPEEIFGDIPSDVEVPENETINSQMVSRENDIDIEKVLAENEQKIADDVSKAMTDVSVPIVEENTNVDDSISRDDIQGAIDEQMANVVADDTSIPVVEENTNVDNSISRDDIQGTIDEQMANVVADDTSIPVVEEENNVDNSISRDDIQGTIDEQMAGVKLISPEDVAEAVSNTSVENENTEEVPLSEDSDSIINREDIESEINDSMSQVFDVPAVVEDKNDSIVPVIPNKNQIDDVSENIEEPTDDEIRDEVDEAIRRIKVSQNGSSEAKIDKFDNDGEQKVKYDYKPMTDEEIEQARENINYYEYEDIYHQRWEDKNKKFGEAVDNLKNLFNEIIDSIPNADEVLSQLISEANDKDEKVRTDIVVAPDRDEYNNDLVDEKSNVSYETTSFPSEVYAGEGQNLHLDYSDATENDVARAINHETTLEGLEALKQRALMLQKENEKARIDIEEALREQRMEAERALEIRRQTEAKKEAYIKKYKRLEDYCDALMHDTDLNRSSARIARNDTEVNRSFIESKEAEMRDYDDKMSEIDSIISSEIGGSRSR